MLLVTTLRALLLCVALALDTNERPHLILILADDLGHFNVGYAGNTEAQTPNIDALAASGLILDRLYAYRSCSPTRSSLLTGRLPIHVNQYNLPENNMEVGGGVHANFTLLSSQLKAGGYATHALGKWHIGMSSPELIPTARGFDSFLGYLAGQVSKPSPYTPTSNFIQRMRIGYRTTSRRT